MQTLLKGSNTPAVGSVVLSCQFAVMGSEECSQGVFLCLTRGQITSDTNDDITARLQKKWCKQSSPHLRTQSLTV